MTGSVPWAPRGRGCTGWRSRTAPCGWRPLGGHSHRWRGKITTDTPSQGAEYAAALVVTDLVTEWKVNGICEQHVRVIVWAGEEGTDPDDAVFTVEIQPRVDTELPIMAGSYG